MAILCNDHIRLRALEPADVPFLYALENDASAWDAGSSSQPFSASSLADFVASQQADLYADKQLRLVICLCEGGVPVGLVDLYDFSPRHRHAWVSVMVSVKHRRQGVALMALQLMADYAFHFLHLRLLMAMVASDNPASLCLFQKAGYIQCGLFPNYYLRSQGAASAVCFQLAAQ